MLKNLVGFVQLPLGLVDIADETQGSDANGQVAGHLGLFVGVFQLFQDALRVVFVYQCLDDIQQSLQDLVLLAGLGMDQLDHVDGIHEIPLDEGQQHLDDRVAEPIAVIEVFEDVQNLADLVVWATLQDHGDGVIDTQVRVGIQKLLRHAFHPACESIELAAFEHLLALGTDQFSGLVDITGQKKLVDGFGVVAVFGKPVAGGMVECLHALRILFGKLVLQQVGEEAVIAVPLTMLVQRDDEQVVAFQVIDDLTAVLAP